ncbi:hypothetical protein AGMMS49991_07760 [Spirochaetia bacterium]|nr:hypothetical protein AGMMS49991_07760 [Spirochaetia bacterium]
MDVQKVSRDSIYIAKHHMHKISKGSFFAKMDPSINFHFVSATVVFNGKVNPLSLEQALKYKFIQSTEFQFALFKAFIHNTSPHASFTFDFSYRKRTYSFTAKFIEVRCTEPSEGSYISWDSWPKYMRS